MIIVQIYHNVAYIIIQKQFTTKKSTIISPLSFKQKLSLVYIITRKQKIIILMFDLRQTFIRSQYQKVGFMHGFIWQRSSAINYGHYSQFWHGTCQDKEKVFRILHRSIQLTRDFRQHLCLQNYHFVIQLLQIPSISFTIYTIYMNIIQQQVQWLILLISILIPILIYILGKFGPIVNSIGKSMLRNKIIKAINTCSQLQLEPLGYIAKFPETSKRFCICIRCCDMCFKKIDISRIQIFDKSKFRSGKAVMPDNRKHQEVTEEQIFD